MPLRPVLITHSDVAHHDAFLRFTPRVFPRFDFRPWYTRGGWTPAYASHALADDGGEIVASVSVMRMRAVVGGREVRAAQLGAVGVVPERRREGLMRPLLADVLRRLDAETDLVFLYANDSVLDFYPRFGFRPARESAFELAVAVHPAPEPAPRLDLDDPSHCGALLAAWARSLPPTERFGARDYGSAALWNVLAFHRDDVHALGPGVHVVAAQRGDVLDLVDVAAPERFDLRAALPRLVRAPVARVRFGFCPELWCPSARAVGPGDDALFVRGGAAPGPEPFKLPALAQT